MKMNLRNLAYATTVAIAMTTVPAPAQQRPQSRPQARPQSRPQQGPQSLGQDGAVDGLIVLNRQDISQAQAEVLLNLQCFESLADPSTVRVYADEDCLAALGFNE